MATTQTTTEPQIVVQGSISDAALDLLVAIVMDDVEEHPDP